RIEQKRRKSPGTTTTTTTTTTQTPPGTGGSNPLPPSTRAGDPDPGFAPVPGLGTCPGVGDAVGRSTADPGSPPANPISGDRRPGKGGSEGVSTAGQETGFLGPGLAGTLADDPAGSAGRPDAFGT